MKIKGITLMDYSSFTEDVQSQLSRGKLKASETETAVIVRLLPCIEVAMARYGFTYDHCGINKTVADQLSVVRFKGFQYRMSISIPPKDCVEVLGMHPFLSLDSHWWDDDAALTTTLNQDTILPLTPDTTEAEIDNLFRLWSR